MKSKTIHLFFLLLFINPITLISQLTYPTRYPTAVIQHPANGNALFFLYQPMQYLDYSGQDTFKMYFSKLTGDSTYCYLGRSLNYGITWSDTQRVSSQEQYESIIPNPDPDSSIIYMAFNKWRGNYVGMDLVQKSYMYKSVSTDGGFTFSDSGQVMELGEDKSFIWNEDTQEYWGYVRPRNIWNDCSCYIHNCHTIGNGVRKIALMKNSGIFTSSVAWSSRDTIVEVSSSDYNNPSSPDYLTQTYYMQVFRNETDWWGLVGMYRVGNNGGETNDYPYTDPEYTSDVELMWSDNGEDWYRTNNRQPLIALHDSIKTIYSVGTIVGDSVYFYSAESTRLHAGYTTNGCGNNSVETSALAGKYYSIYLYKMSSAKLNEWRPSSVVNVTSTIEGFLNSGTGKHNLRDTLTGKLRNTTSPYAVVSTNKAVVDSVSFQGIYDFPHVSPGSYYLTLEGRNSLETWSSSSITISNGSASNYNFTTAGTQAYGSNLILKSGKYCIYSGDVNNDDFIDITDVSLIEADALAFVTGYVDTDITGDGIVDITDQAIADNNSSSFVGLISP